MSEANDTTECKEVGAPFYVGYLPLPSAIRRFLISWVVGNLVLAIGVAAVLASQQRDPGDGVWDTSEAVTREGLLVFDPYPRLILEGDNSSSPQSVLPIEQGKVGSQARLAEYRGTYVRLTGFTIERHGNHLLELLPGEEAIEVVSQATMRAKADAEQDLGVHTLVGEIVDPKCYLGVMKPGDGKPHKVCATLCITGGIPPMFVVRDSSGQTTAYLLTDTTSKPMPEPYYEYIADPVSLSGRVQRKDGQLFLQADFSTLKRHE